MSLSFAVLGCAGAAPLEGACSSYLVSDGASRVLLDCGPGTLERVWRHDLLPALDAIVISHMHMDHVLDLLPFSGELVRAELARRRPVLCVPEGDGMEVLRALDLAMGGKPRGPTRFEATFDIREYTAEDHISFGSLDFTFAATAHPQPCFAARASSGTTALVYGADGGPSESVRELAADVDLLVLEATYTYDAAMAGTHGHMTATQAGQLACDANAARLLLTHLLPGTKEHLIRLAATAFDGRIDLAVEDIIYDLR